MATGLLCPVGLFIQFFSNQGVVLAGGKVFTYVAGTTTLQDTYTDDTLTVLNANPIILDATGRLPASCWVASGTIVKCVIEDSVGNVLATIDDLPAINDITSTVLPQLANPATGSGADLVANALRSYPNFAAMRAGVHPSLGTGQTLIVVAEGQGSVNDGLGGAFYWSQSSTAVDDNFNVIQVSGVATGRYLRLDSPITNGITLSTGTSFSLGTNGTATVPLIRPNTVAPIITPAVIPTSTASGGTIGLEGWVQFPDGTIEKWAIIQLGDSLVNTWTFTTASGAPPFTSGLTQLGPWASLADIQTGVTTASEKAIASLLAITGTPPTGIQLGMHNTGSTGTPCAFFVKVKGV